MTNAQMGIVEYLDFMYEDVLGIRNNITKEPCTRQLMMKFYFA